VSQFIAIAHHPKNDKQFRQPANRRNLVELELVDSAQPSALKLAALSAIDDYAPGSEILAFEA
jgi:hypothetical protein